jgi:hypothetical protein
MRRLFQVFEARCGKVLALVIVFWFGKWLGRIVLLFEVVIT